MGGRPGLEVGTYGKVRYALMPDGRTQARALFRDVDGRSRPVTRLGKNETDADRNLRRALLDRKRVAGDQLIRSDMRVTALADLWLARIDASDKAVNTKQQYRKLVDAYIRAEVGQLRVQEATVGRCDAALQRIAIVRGPSVASACRAVLSGIMGLAARHDAIPSNPVRDTDAIAGASIPKKGRPRALEPEEVEKITDGLRTLPRAVELDMPDLVDFCLATGARIGEALACRASALDLDAGLWTVNATVVRVKGAGLILQQTTKSEAGLRTLALPPFAVQMIRDRLTGNAPTPRLRGPHGVVFGSPARRSLRDPSNAAGDLKECLKLLDPELHWVTFHTFRKTVLTRMDQAGFTDREMADQAGHARPSMTSDVYKGRGVASTKAATLLDR